MYIVYNHYNINYKLIVDMKQSGWYVVKCVNEKTIETIPSSWLVNFDNSVWPTTLSTSKISLTIKNSLKPTNNSRDWTFF